MIMGDLLMFPCVSRVIPRIREYLKYRFLGVIEETF